MSRVSYAHPSARAQPFVGARFILECSRKLSLPCLASATACALFHTFNRNRRRARGGGEAEAQQYEQYVSRQPSMEVGKKIPGVNSLIVQY